MRPDSNLLSSALYKPSKGLQWNEPRTRSLLATQHTLIVESLSKIGIDFFASQYFRRQWDTGKTPSWHFTSDGQIFEVVDYWAINFWERRQQQHSFSVSYLRFDPLDDTNQPVSHLGGVFHHPLLNGSFITVVVNNNVGEKTINITVISM